MQNRFALRCLALVALAVMAPSCASWYSPSSSAVERAVLESLRRDGVPVGMSGNTVWGEKNVEAEVVVIKIGTQQGTGSNSYWPVRVGVKGTYVANYDRSNGSFSGEAEYVMRRNAFGEWAASHSSTR